MVIVTLSETLTLFFWIKASEHDALRKQRKLDLIRHGDKLGDPIFSLSQGI